MYILKVKALEPAHERGNTERSQKMELKVVMMVVDIQFYALDIGLRH